MTRRPPSLDRLICSIAVAALVMLATDAWCSGGVAPFGPEPVAFAVFAGLGLLSELRPLRWLRPQEGEDVTASWTFIMALLLTGSPVASAATAAAIFVCGDLVARKSLDRVCFNASQIVVSVSLGALLVRACGQAGAISDPRHLGLVWWPTFLATCVVVFAVNILLTSTVIAVHRGLPVAAAIRAAGVINLSTDGMLLGLSPVLVVIAEQSLVLVPLLLVAIVTVYRSAEQALSRRHEATHDQLTDLPNRRLFNERLDAAVGMARSSGGRIALVLLDLDGFKGINDRLGHLVGDEVLVQVAARLDASRRPSDHLCRLGGDEFGLLITSLDDVAVALSVAARLRACFDDVFVVDGLPLSVGVSIGVAVLPDHAGDPEVLFRRADEAMYDAKGGRSGVVLYRPNGNEATVGRLGLMADLSNALPDDQLFLEYQPQVTVATGEICGVEALVRWRHPVAGVIAPGAFMPLAEQTELIGPITEWVLGNALAQWRRWEAVGIELDMAVNISARDLRDVRFPATVARLLRMAGVPPRRLNLEVTESASSVDPSTSQKVLRELREVGVTVSIDDFGTGFSSLAQLRDLVFDEIKIDRTFVGNMVGDSRDCLIVRSILQLGASLGVTTVAEGVEDQLVLDLLRDLGCDRAQGFLLAPPLSPEALAGRVRRSFAPLAVDIPLMEQTR